MAGALASGVIADLFGFTAAIQAVAVLTVASGLVATRTVASRKEIPE